MARQNFLGLVVSQGKMMKTVKVRVETKVFNKRINKELFRRKDYLVHDEGEVSREGDLVRIEATRPLSKRKFFSIAEIIKNKGQQFALYESQAMTRVAEEEAQKTQKFLSKRQQLSAQESVLLMDIRKIQEALASGQSAEELVEIKERYGLENFTAGTLRELLQLDIMALGQRVEDERKSVETVQGRVRELMGNDPDANAFLRENGVMEPEQLKSNIKKNLIRKYVMQSL
ncbi:LAMI_0C02432g1_1 [Lachancea mirantina]|uniref:LAMI_0C02432g1_1 n=1 Tax=Lachancea mirantina TaxID=1230905 RepID=A0A1G4J127_9SACH|nr:LAMI_0C02432g1_1 [Lachancea mirantina]